MGDHQITFLATDSGGRTIAASKRLIIENNPPRITIFDPEPDSPHYKGLPITLRARVTDRETGALRGESLVWTSSAVEGRLGTGRELTAVTITLPQNYSGLSDREDDCLTLVAEACDLQDGRLSGDSITREDRRDDIGTVRTFRGERVEACDFSTGAHDTWHTIRVTATDSNGASVTDEIRIYVIPGGLI